MVQVALSTIIFTAYQPLSLAIVMAVAVMYFIPSAINAIRHDKKRTALWYRLLIIAPPLLFLFAGLHPVRAQLLDSAPNFGPIILATTFGSIL